MSTPTITPAAVAAEAHAVLHVLMETAWPRHEDIVSAATDLDRALGNYGLIARGEITWERFYPELSAEADPHGAALEKAAREADDAAEALVRAIAAHGGIEVAEALTGAAK